MGSFKIMDGAMGSELIRRGLTLPEHTWSADANITNPEMVQNIHSEYIDAGADFITANTFRTTPRAYEKTRGRNKKTRNIKPETALIARTSLYKGVALAKETAGNSVQVAGSIAPLEDCYTPYLFPGKNDAVKEFSQLGVWLARAGVDILILETMNSLVETEAALIGIQNLTLPIWVSFVLKDDSHLLSGDSLIEALNMLKNYPVDTVLLNCNPLDRTLLAAKYLMETWSHKWGVYPNLGIGEPSPNGHVMQYEEMESFLSTIKKIIKFQPSIIGACCGSSPEHIRALSNFQYEFNK